mgnify:CR=1 FL=1
MDGLHPHLRDISIHALREEGDFFTHTKAAVLYYFYPRPPRGGRPFLSMSQGEGIAISIHALREEGDMGTPAAVNRIIISIHALREEGDPGVQ